MGGAALAGGARPEFRVFVAVSLDGLIARPDGRLDWLPGATPDSAPAPAGEDHGYAAFMAGVDTLLMGRETFGTVRDFPEWPYAGLRVVVLSRTLTAADLPPALRGAVQVMAGTPEQVAEELGHLGARAVYVDGGQTVQAFLRAGLIDELTVTVVPVLLGRGRPLFGPLGADLPLKLVSARVFSGSGFVQSTYRRRDGR
ncbi:deaminase reductase [Deinococcus seoulensis]|uniref:Deaminase reductase n=1 Tax=Deinococcus seoulensis TaxID=1837379 RepID=A0ABQ2RX73_9DEIO|nr:dihydrofolate reductase family protein [Deinococcus seoulensis]GGR63181.1 deaminase reductase [Deinococcus seoulensis]